MSDLNQYQYGYNPDELDKNIYTPHCIQKKWGYFCQLAKHNYVLQHIFIKQGHGCKQENVSSSEILLYVEQGQAVVKVYALNNNQPEEVVHLKPQETLLVPTQYGYQLGGTQDCHIYTFSGQVSLDNLDKEVKKSKTFDVRHKDWAERCIETIINKEYTGKRIYFTKGSSSSLHFHCEKKETYLIHSGKLFLRLKAGQGEDRFFILEPGDAIDLTPGLMHQAGALEDTVIIEISTHDKDSDSFIVEGELEEMPKLKDMLNNPHHNLLNNKKILNKPLVDLESKDKNMKLFLDTANLEEIDKGLQLGILSGITTNPALIAKEPKADFLEHIKKITALCKKHNQEIPLSIEVFKTDPDEMIQQAKDFVAQIDYANINIKIPVGFEEMRVITKLGKSNIPVNCTCGFNEAQAVLAANAGAKYFSFFCGRMKDIGVNPFEVIKNTRKLLEGTNTEIIIGSIRHMQDLVDSHLAGAHIVTAPLAILEKMAIHPKTTESINQFLDEFNEWINKS